MKCPRCESEFVSCHVYYLRCWNCGYDTKPSRYVPRLEPESEPADSGGASDG